MRDGAGSVVRFRVFDFAEDDGIIEREGIAFELALEPHIPESRCGATGQCANPHLAVRLPDMEHPASGR